MKKNIFRAVFCLTLMATATTAIVSCSRSDDNTENNTSTVDPANFKGEIKAGTTVTLDPSKVYNLSLIHI